MKKIKITILAEIEYEPNPKHYQPSHTLNEMLDCDLRNAEDDPFLMLDGEDVKWTITGELIG